MGTVTLVISIILAVAAIALAVLALLAPAEGAARRVAKRVGLPLPEQPLRDLIARRAHHTRRWVAVSGSLALLGTVVAVAIATTGGAMADPGTELPWIAVGGTLLGVAAGALLGVLSYRPPVDPDRPRVAHAQHTTLRDYLDPMERIGARIVVALGAVVAVGVMVVPGAATDAAGPGALTVVVLAAVGVIGLLAVELGGPRIVLARPRPSATPEALRWDDAQRADDLRTLVTGPIMTGSYASIIGLAALASAVPANVDRVLLLIVNNGGFFLLVVALLVVAGIALARRPGQYYRRRLWPEPGAATADGAPR